MRWPGQPFGLLGWQGVVPAKRFQMASTMVDVTISQLLSISEVFAQLDPAVMAPLLASSLHDAVFGGLLPVPVLHLYLRRVCRDMIAHIESVLDIKALVVRGMTADPATMGRFFQRVGSSELAFLVESGTYFGLLLGLLQMLQWALYPVNWTLPVGGTIVGLVTNWIALKWVFEPLHPTRIGPFVLQGLFLRRQYEVSAEFSSYVSKHVLTSQRMWGEMLSGSSVEVLRNIVRRNVPFMSPHRLDKIVHRLRCVLTSLGSSGVADVASAGAVATASGAATFAAALPAPSHPLHSYIDGRLGLRTLLVSRMRRLSPEQFERVLHPIFQEDELTLILAGGALGCLAGLLQWRLNVLGERRRRSRAHARHPAGATIETPAGKPAGIVGTGGAGSCISADGIYAPAGEASEENTTAATAVPCSENYNTSQVVGTFSHAESAHLTQTPTPVSADTNTDHLGAHYGSLYSAAPEPEPEREAPIDRDSANCRGGGVEGAHDKAEARKARAAGGFGDEQGDSNSRWDRGKGSEACGSDENVR